MLRFQRPYRADYYLSNLVIYNGNPARFEMWLKRTKGTQKNSSVILILANPLLPPEHPKHNLQTIAEVRTQKEAMAIANQLLINNIVIQI